MKKRNIVSILVYVVIIAIALFWILNLFGGAAEVSYAQAVRLIREEKVDSFYVSEDVLYLQLKESYNGQNELTAPMAQLDAFREELGAEIDRQYAEGILSDYNYYATARITPADFILPALVVGLLLLLLWFILMSRANARNGLNNFGKARTVLGLPDDQKVTFADVAGADEEKQELEEIVDFLRNPEKYTAIGAKIPHGILLEGPPGTGKTLLARAVAGEADVEFLSISGSDFVEMYVGVGASRVRDLFAQAKQVAPAIIFIDEIDAVGRKRGSGLGGGHDEKEQTLNQLLVEMDGFGRTEGVIVMAATNRPDILDPALLRPGRFDRQIHVGLPDVKGREEILHVHAKGKKLDGDVELKTVARVTVGFSGADLSNLMNEAAILAARDDRPVIAMRDLDEAMMKITAGPEKRSHVAQRKDLEVTAIHEAGHAVAMHLLPTQDKILQVTVVPRGRSLGATWHIPKDDSSNMTRNEMYETIVSLLAGRVAEDLYVGDISVGASNDIDRATKLAKDMVARYGMCEKLGAVSYIGGGEVFIGRDYQSTKSYSEKYAGTIDDEVKALADRAYAHCRSLLQENSEKLLQVRDYLLEHETMTGKQFEACMAGEPIPEDNSETVFFDQVETVETTEE